MDIWIVSRTRASVAGASAAALSGLVGAWAPSPAAVQGSWCKIYILHVTCKFTFFYSKMISPIFILHQFLHLPKNQVMILTTEGLGHPQLGAEKS